MSGGAFWYSQDKIYQIADEIEQIIANNESTEKDEYGDEVGYFFNHETISKFRKAVHTLRRAHVMAQRVDWLLSGDDGEESFHQRWVEELAALEKEEADDAM